MSAQIEFRLNKATAAEIAGHLSLCDADFVPPLSGRIEIGSYANKIAGKATRFEAWANGALVGLVAAYCNDSERRTAYITSVSVLRGWQDRGIASRLLEQCIEFATGENFARIELATDSGNTGAIGLYAKRGFTTDRANDSTAIMRLDIAKHA